MQWFKKTSTREKQARETPSSSILHHIRYGPEAENLCRVIGVYQGSGFQLLVYRLFQLEHPTTVIDPQVEEWIEVTTTGRFSDLLKTPGVGKAVAIGLVVLV